jgi:hypothetical protein
LDRGRDDDHAHALVADTSLSGTRAERCRMTICSRSARRTTSSGSTSSLAHRTVFIDFDDLQGARIGL